MLDRPGRDGAVARRIAREAVRRALARVKGAYAIVVMCDQNPETLVAAKNASPLVLGLGEGENFVASDIPAILAHTRKMIFLEEGEIASVSKRGVSLMDLAGKTITRDSKEITWSASWMAASLQPSDRMASTSAPVTSEGPSVTLTAKSQRQRTCGSSGACR